MSARTWFTPPPQPVFVWQTFSRKDAPPMFCLASPSSGHKGTSRCDHNCNCFHLSRSSGICFYLKSLRNMDRFACCSLVCGLPFVLPRKRVVSARLKVMIDHKLCRLFLILLVPA